MKRTVLLLISGVLFASMLVLGVTSRMQAQNGNLGCSLSTLQGTYGILATGFIQTGFPTPSTASNPNAQVGVISADGKGNAVGRFVFSFNGAISPITDFSSPQVLTQNATYTVNPDCTGSVTVSPPDSGSAAIVIVKSGSEFFLLQTNPGQVVSGIGIKQ